MEYHYKTSCLDLRQTLESGQCFRWRRQEDGSYIGISGCHILKIAQTDDGAILTVRDKTEADYWLGYFDSATDYEAVIKQFSPDRTLSEAAAENRGIRILRQEPFETLISFIISQNNNIPRITGIISRLCESFGDRISDEYGGMYSFPDAKRLAALTPDDLAPLRAGFRVRYILDAAYKVADGTVDLGSIRAMSYDDGKAYLKTITGVGDKVADCVLLFAYHKTEAFPSDVWIKRIVAEYYSDGLPECMGDYKGIAQQYLFEYFRKRTPVK
ncbi:MAG: DNA-3-methyladenine glycosylase 2 [Ruminiclostridium sp.]|nr:DNA-3-methyladenine glycosylase 2 [Ruminiclostridium sp.]